MCATRSVCQELKGKNVPVIMCDRAEHAMDISENYKICSNAQELP